MKSKYYILFVFLIFGSCFTNKKVTDGKEEVLQIVDLEVDKLGDYYTINNIGSIKKYQDAKLIYTYSNRSLGKLAMIDVSNPHKIILFYREQQVILLLDNSLSEIGRIELDNSSNIVAVGAASDGYLWVFDSFLLRLKKINSAGEYIEESFPSNTIIPEDIIDSKIIDRGNYVVIADKYKGILLYNNLGYYEKTLLIENPIKPSIIEGKLYYFNKKNNSYSNYDFYLKETTEVFNFDSTKYKPQIVIFENEKFYLLNKNKVIKFLIR